MKFSALSGILSMAIWALLWGDAMESCCFTGHRKIPEAERSTVQKRLHQMVKALLNREIATFYCGGALGFDTLVARPFWKRGGSTRRWADSRPPLPRSGGTMAGSGQAALWIHQTAGGMRWYIFPSVTRGEHVRAEPLHDRSQRRLHLLLHKRSRRHGIYGELCAGKRAFRSFAGAMKNPLTHGRGKQEFWQ